MGYDDRTNRIVSFDVEPGFDHQWGYGRQRFMASSKLSEKCKVARYRAIIKKHSDQHEYELGKYTIELLRQAKNQSIEVKDLVTFIAEQTEEEVKQVQMLNNMKAELEKLKLETNSQQVKISELERQIAELEALKKTQEKKIESLNEQVKSAQEQQAQAKLATDSAQVAIDWE